MDDAREPQSEHSSPYLRLPWPAVVAILVGTLALILAAGIYANRNLRPQAGVVATQAVVAATPVIAAVPSATPVPAVAVAPTPAVLASQASPTATDPASCDYAIRDSWPDRDGCSNHLTDSRPALADEIGKAYVTYWRVRSQATLDLDSTHLPEVMDGDYLQSFAAHLEELREQGQAIKTKVDLNYEVVQANSDAAIVHDRIEDNSFYVEPGTDNALSDPSNEQSLIEFKLRNFNGTWKVVDSVRAES